ncbi:hypothetical protein JCGZ_03327 [Jatropha curcas]|uniref:Uncharacterized protein n=1 Tax=Jatropha curcas TaxID=180498 RepID=A0A067JCU9_JATCU|nr:hypothetical protein JCGZ_03327 [Jatropha curcas]
MAEEESEMVETEAPSEPSPASDPASAPLQLSIRIPALYSKYEEHVDRYGGMIQKIVEKVSNRYKVVDVSVTIRIQQEFIQGQRCISVTVESVVQKF